jgi:N utilization substance protein B
MNRRRAARFGAVQALYQAEMSGTNITQIIAEFRAFRLADLLEPLELEEKAPEVDRAWFDRITEGTWTEIKRLDQLIEPKLAQDWTLDRLGFLLRAFLRAGTYELAYCADVPPKVVLNEYTELAHAFLSQDDAGFLNAVLDRLAPEVRAGDAGLSPAARIDV